METHQREIQIFGNFPSLFMGLVAPDGAWEHHDGNLRFSDSSGSIIADQLDPRKYFEFIGESVQGSSYLKSPYYTPLGFPDGMYRVGPLARLNVCERMGVPQGGRRAEEFQEPGPGRGHFLVSLSLRAAHRNPGRAGIHRALPGRPGFVERRPAGRRRHQQPARRGRRARLRAARCSTTTPWIATACCKR